MNYHVELHVLDNDSEISYGIKNMNKEGASDILFARTGYVPRNTNHILSAIENLIEIAGGFENIKDFKLYVNSKYFIAVESILINSKYDIIDTYKVHPIYPIANITIWEKDKAENEFKKFIKELPTDEFVKLLSELTKQGKSLKDLEKAYNALGTITKFVKDKVKETTDYLK